VKHLILSGLLLALAACGGREDAAPPEPLSLRNPAAPLGGTSRFDAGRFAGDWVTRACLGPCAPGVSFTQSLTGAVIENDGSASRAFVPGAPGILRAAEGEEVLVVMWVDEGFRTAAVGRADGSRAAIIDRAPTGGEDRITAAREILDFNGWDVSRLRRVK
jgi:apolipoprotein D and lipocalin family protein